METSTPLTPLFEKYTATLSVDDQEIYHAVREYALQHAQIPVGNLPLFGPNGTQAANKSNNKASNPLFVHSAKANAILGLIDERKAFQTALEYEEKENGEGQGQQENHYDLRFLLPLVCHALDPRNICDSVKVIHNGWIYLIVRGLSLEDAVLRNTAFLAYKLLTQNFQLPKRGFKAQDIKVWLHFLLSVRKGIQNLGRCKISPLLSTWLVASWECLREPSHSMYKRLTTFLFAKPVIDLKGLPEFMPFFNATDGNKTTREWMFQILKHGLKTREDWQVAQRLPTINSLCSSFLVEDVFVQREILFILTRGAKIPEVAVEMVEKHSILLWIANLPSVDAKNKNLMYRRELNLLFTALRDNCPQNESRQMIFQFVANKHEWLETV